MNEEMRVRNLSVPNKKVDVVIDTDTFNEIDDQYALAYLLKSKDKLCTKAIYAAPYSRAGSGTVKEGMERSYNEIIKVLSLLKEDVAVFKGSEQYLSDEKTAVVSPAALDLAERANAYSPENPLYVIAIGAITNVASAILLNPKMIENTVIIWLGGHAYHYTDAVEFNLKQDIAGGRVVFGCGIPLVQLPCRGVVSEFIISKPELEEYFIGKNELSTYLANITIDHANKRFNATIWSKPLWDVTAVAYLLNDDDRFMLSRFVRAPLPSYDGHYVQVPNAHLIKYVYYVKRDELMRDLIEKLTR